MHYRDESTGAQCTTLCPFHENTHHDCVLIKSHYGICSRSGSISHFLCINQRFPSGSATLLVLVHVISYSNQESQKSQSEAVWWPLRGLYIQYLIKVFILQTPLCASGGLLRDFIWHFWKTSGPQEQKQLRGLNL